jgi:acetyl-CoA synthetase
VVYAVVNSQMWKDASALQKELQARLRTELNPLFRIDAVQIIDALPRTASNKVMRRMLRQKQ